MASAQGGAGTAAAYDLTSGGASSSVSPTRRLYRDPAAPRQPSNIMYDKRVVRGNTFAAPVIPPVSAARCAICRDDGWSCRLTGVGIQQSVPTSNQPLVLLLVAGWLVRACVLAVRGRGGGAQGEGGG